MDKSKSKPALIRVSFKVPHQVRAALADEAEQTGVSLPIYVRTVLTPVVPDLICTLAGFTNIDQEAA